jgi:hypothetical protein
MQEASGQNYECLIIRVSTFGSQEPCRKVMS